MRELVEGKNTIGRTAAVLKKPYKATFTFTFYCFIPLCNKLAQMFFCLFSWRHNPLWLYFHSPVTGFSFLVFEVSLSHIKRRVTVGRTPLDEWSIRHRDLYLTTHYTHNRQTSMPPVGFEPTISAGDMPKTYALDRAADGTGTLAQIKGKNWLSHKRMFTEVYIVCC